MSGASLPYHLRPHKSVDRRLFLDLLMRLERWRPLVDYAYISMGAYPLEDHKLVHRHLGIDKLIAFDNDEKIVARQKTGDLLARLQQQIQRNVMFFHKSGSSLFLFCFPVSYSGRLPK